MIQNGLPVLFNRKIKGDYYRLGIGCGEDYARAYPGQFVMLKTAPGMVPLLRRPFSIHNMRIAGGRIEGLEILYKVVGTGTRQLTRLVEGQRVDMIGPLGRGFDFVDTAATIMIVAGGVGIAPMVFLASELMRQGRQGNRCRVFLGGRSADDILCHSRFEAHGMRVQVATEDGTTGQRGLVTAPLEQALRENRPERMYACGPEGMLRSVSKLALQSGVSCQVSVETMMACGMGACLGCAVGKQGDEDGYLHACLDGPVLDSARIQWEPDRGGFGGQQGAESIGQRGKGKEQRGER